VLTVGIAMVPGVTDHARSVLEALAPWTGGYRLPNFTFDAAELPSAYDDWTRARLRHAVHTFDPEGVIAIGRVF